MKNTWHKTIVVLVSCAMVVILMALFATPILAATNFGVTTTGSTSYPPTNVGETVTGTALDSAAYLEVDSYTTTVPLTAMTIRTYGTAGGNVKVSIYNDDGVGSPSHPNTLLFTEVASAVTANTWSTITISNIYLAPGKYWIAFNISAESVITHNTTAVSGSTRYFKSWAYATAFPTTAGTSGWTTGAGSDNTYFVGYPVEGYAKATKVTLSANSANIISMSFYSHATGNVRLAIYSDSSGPSALQWESGSTAVVAGWNVVNISSGPTTKSLVLNTGTYWLAWQWDSANSGPSYTVGGAGTGNYITLAYGSFPSSWSGGTSSTENWSIYASYVTWDSYREVGHSNIDNDYVSPYTTAFMYGASFDAGSYLVAYYDAGGVKRGSETISASGGTLASQYLLTSDATAAAGLWHALVQPSSGYTPFGTNSYSTIVASPGTYGLLANDSFTVEPSAIPEFPTMFAALGVAVLCFAIYYWMRKRRLALVKA